jgi:hypothetical protein
MRTLIEFRDKDNLLVSSSTIEILIDFSREDYENFREKSDEEMVDFDEFLINIVEKIEAYNGTLQDAIDLAHIRINDFKPSSIN